MKNCKLDLQLTKCKYENMSGELYEKGLIEHMKDG
jgi:hypothetical protein